MPSSSDHSRHSRHSRHSPTTSHRHSFIHKSPSTPTTTIPIPTTPLGLTPYTDASPPRALHRGPSEVDQREQDVQAALQFSRARSGTYERHPDDDISGPRRPSTLISPSNTIPQPITSDPHPRFFHHQTMDTPSRTSLLPSDKNPIFDIGLNSDRLDSSASLDSSPGEAFIDHRHHQHRSPHPGSEPSPAYFRSLLIQSDPSRLPANAEEHIGSPRRENASLIDHRDWGSPGRAPTGRGIAGMLPHFPYPFDFGALEAFAAAERKKSSLPSGDQGKVIAGSAEGRGSLGGFEESTGSFLEHERAAGRRRIGFVEGATPDADLKEILNRRTNENRRPGEVVGPGRRLSESTGPMAGRQRKLALFEGDMPAGKKGAIPPTGSEILNPPVPRSQEPQQEEEEARSNKSKERPYRFSFYSNALPSTIHARSLGEIPGPGENFRDLFVGHGAKKRGEEVGGLNGVGSEASSFGAATVNGKSRTGVLMRTDEDAEANTWWLDVLSPTNEEMKLLSKVFGIHPLTTEDIQMEETREKIELFRNYYLVCFRSFDQDPYSPTYLEPLNMYIIVFREGTLSFHFRGTPHPQNVRRRIKQLKDYINVTSDWISYALIDDITDAFGPLIQSIEYEVDSIDELVLILKDAEQSDMLRRIGTCRKKVMGLLRLMGNKADVVKGLAKRCNENWSVAPKSDIGLYLSDIQDHLVTMTQNLNHYEKILSRSHSNYLAQISIEMTDANNQINDVLSKLTALGSILIPMNLVTGLWGMNVHVPGQDIEEGYAWFISIVCGLVSFGVFGAWLTLRYFKFSKG